MQARLFKKMSNMLLFCTVVNVLIFAWDSSQLEEQN